MPQGTASIMYAELMLALAARMTQQLSPMRDKLDPKRVQYWLSEGGAELKAKMQQMLVWDQHRALASWDAFYKVFFDKETLLATAGCGPRFKIPDFQPGFDRLIVVAQGITLDQVITACQQYFPVFINGGQGDQYQEWLASLKDDRTPAEQGYAILVRDSAEADPGLAEKSASQLAEESIQGMTLLECLLFELKYYSETGFHLDGTYRPQDEYDFSFPLPSTRHPRTLVTGTHDDKYWSVHWCDSTHVFIDWTHSDAKGFELSSRQVICAE